MNTIRFVLFNTHTYFLTLFVFVFSGCVVLEDEEALAFGDRGVWIRNYSTSNISVLLNGRLVIKEIEPEKHKVYIQNYTDTNSLKFTVVDALTTNIILTNFFVPCTFTRSMSGNDIDLEKTKYFFSVYPSTGL